MFRGDGNKEIIHIWFMGSGSARATAHSERSTLHSNMCERESTLVPQSKHAGTESACIRCEVVHPFAIVLIAGMDMKDEVALSLEMKEAKCEKETTCEKCEC